MIISRHCHYGGLTRGHDGVLVEAPEDVDVQDAEAHLEARGEDLHQHGARGDDPAPAALGVIMLEDARNAPLPVHTGVGHHTVLSLLRPRGQLSSSDVCHNVTS